VVFYFKMHWSIHLVCQKRVRKVSQLVALIADSTIIMASDRRVEVSGEEGKAVHSLRKLYPLGVNCAVATLGAAVTIDTSRKLAQALARRPAMDFSEVEDYAMGVFQQDYDAFVKAGASWFGEHSEAPTLSYIMLAGRNRDSSCHLRFYASETHGEPYRALPVADVLCAPRRVGLETRLKNLLASGGGLDAVRPLLLDNLYRIASLDEAVEGPFDLAVLGPCGIKMEIAEAI